MGVYIGDKPTGIYIGNYRHVFIHADIISLLQENNQTIETTEDTGSDSILTVDEENK